MIFAPFPSSFSFSSPRGHLGMSITYDSSPLTNDTVFDSGLDSYNVDGDNDTNNDALDIDTMLHHFSDVNNRSPKNGVTWCLPLVHHHSYLCHHLPSGRDLERRKRTTTEAVRRRRTRKKKRARLALTRSLLALPETSTRKEPLEAGLINVTTMVRGAIISRESQLRNLLKNLLVVLTCISI